MIKCRKKDTHIVIWEFLQETNFLCVGVEGGGGGRNALKSFEPGLEQRVGFSQVQLGPGGEQQKPRHEGRELHGHNHETVRR